MLDFKIIQDKKTGKRWIETSLTGKPLLTTPQLNKGTAFTEQERHEFRLKGKLPIRIEPLAEQIVRAYQQYSAYQTNLQKNIYLNVLHNTNQVLFYGLVKQHLTEMIPIVYTPIVGMRIKESSREFRQARGLYITIQDIDDIAEILDNRSNPEIDIIVITDGERTLGLGDQGVGAMDIPVAKLMLYSLCAGIDPMRTLPILLDVGTNNQELLDDPLYLGLRQHRVTGKAYDDFINAVVTAIKRKFPKIFFHWEDFSRENASKNLNRFRDAICSFNDDIQGTGVVSLAALLSALKLTGSQLSEQHIVVFGAGSAGIGVSNQIYAAMLRNGLNEREARNRFWLVDKPGLLTDAITSLTTEQRPYARSVKEIANWKVKNNNSITLEEVIANVKPTVLIGTAALAGAFNETIIKTMAKFVKQPIIFPLSNPTEKSEATPADLLNWTNGQALVATGSPFPDVSFNGQSYRIAQCNNAFSFPGIGLGAIAVKGKKVSDNMLWIAAETLSNWTTAEKDATHCLLPCIEDAPKVAKAIAISVAKAAQSEGLATINSDPEALVNNYYWEPHYLPYKLIDNKK